VKGSGRQVTAIALNLSNLREKPALKGGFAGQSMYGRQSGSYPETALWEVKDRFLSGLSANRTLSSDDICSR
jgi:hypothetical protein